MFWKQSRNLINNFKNMKNPINTISSELVELIADLTKCDATKINKQSPISFLGLNSLILVDMSAKIENKYKIKVPLKFIYKNPNIHELSEYIAKTVEQDKK